MNKSLRNLIDVNNNFSEWKDSIRVRIKIANETSSRAKYTLIFLSLVSSGFIMVIFSYFYSWNKEIAYQYLSHKSEINIVRDGIIKEWLSTQTYQLPIIGIKIMASDIQIFAPLILMVVSTWNYYEVRREHFTVGGILNDMYAVLNNLILSEDTKAIILCQEVYHNLIGYTVFNVVLYDKPISNLENPVITKQAIEGLSMRDKINAIFRRIIIKVLVATPLISLAVISITRVLTFFIIKSSVTGSVHSIKTLDGFRSSLLILSAILAIISFYICFVNMKKVFTLDNSTRKLLSEYYQWAFEG